MKAVYVAPPPIRPTRRLTARLAADVMSDPVDTIPADAPLDDALRAMVRLHHRHLVAVDRDGRCAGVLSDRAIAAEWARDPASLPVRRVASTLATRPAVVGPLATILDVARFMRATGTDAVAVADTDGYPLGIVTGTDLVALLAA
ncbi:CBS domain-containing protein [Phytohabitans sp. ZYX-F-186]|uniref:CBS domain-containing protein n=1 Tax=Phytohabitans maris TaxID=3071409 RepID=A0ABU0ZWT0_9ACTN|nr:CBS domain-containing protein [Phytohabitans sp. ZYX-F-186]MDQ7910417.1 CBS domain-containing protein [Phytohabitans sp. ZYX-F-186]